MLQLALIALLLPAASFLLLAVVAPLRRRGRLAGFFSSAAAVTTLVASVFALLRYETASVHTVPWLVARGQVIAELGVRIDGISLSMLVVVALVASCVQIYSLGYLHDEPEPSLGRYFAWQSLFVFAMQTLVLAPNLLQLFAGWELVGLCSYLLIGYFWTKPSAGKAAVKAFWVNKFADMGLMAGVIILFTATGSFGWDTPLETSVATLVAGLLLVGVMGKSAQFPLHVWLPDAMEGPTPVSALLHAATMVAAGVFLVVRTFPIFEAAPGVLVFMTWLGACTALMAGITAMVQDDIKKVLAYSTCSQLGYMVAALGAGELTGGFFHLTTHAFFKALLFLGAGAAIHAVHSNSIHDMGGLLKKTPISGWLFVLGTAALIGLPPFAGFFSKDLILEELERSHQYGPLAILVLTAGITAWYMTRVISIAWLGTSKKEHLHEAPLSMLVPMLLLGVLSVVGGALGWMLPEVWGVEYHFALSPVGITTSAVGLLSIGLSYARYARGSKLLPTLSGVRSFILWGPVDRFWVSLWRGGLLPGARGIGWTDRYIVDGLINMVAWAAMRGSAALRTVQTGKAQDYVFAIVLGLIIYAAYGVVGS